MDAIETEDLNKHLQLAEARAKVQICVRLAPEDEKVFTARLSSWTTFHAAALARGATLAEREGFNRPPGSVERFAAMSAQILEALPDDDRQRRCRELLKKLATPTNK